MIVDQIRVRTGLKVETIDNAQQRFLLLKSVARGMRNFEQLIDDGAAIVDMAREVFRLRFMMRQTDLYAEPEAWIASNQRDSGRPGGTDG